MPNTSVTLNQPGGEVIPLREHLDAVVGARDRVIEVQIQALTETVRAAQAQGSREHAEVRSDLQSLRTDVAQTNTAHAALALKVENLASAAAATTALRAGDLAKL